MKTHTSGFKNQIKLIGKEIDSKITFGDTTLGKNELNAVTPSFQGSILKSVMKQLEIDSNVMIPIGAILTYEFGLKVNGEYEYINFGEYIVKEVEKQEDTGSYKILCYDKLLLSMKDYVKLPITYPISVRDYINTLCVFLGLNFANRNDTFVNYNKMIKSELYLDASDNSLGYTFRDVFDELAQVTASTICINDSGSLEIRYINNTFDTIDEEYLKDINVNFGEKYGKINSIVLSRAGESDNVYLRDEQSVQENGLCELKIIDNQIMNFNDRADYLPDILQKLNGLEYYLNDFSSTGICYYDLCDRYDVKIGENTYSCVMFNDEILVTQGLEENVFTEMPEETQTDYTKADKTDRRINQAYIIVDKQNQQIESVVSQTEEQNQKIARVTQTVDELNSKISDIADITTSQESNDGRVSFENINASEPIRIVIRPNGEHISYLYPNSELYPSNRSTPEVIGIVPSENLTPSSSLTPKKSVKAQSIFYPKNRIIRFENIQEETIIDYEIPNDLYYYNDEIYDEFIMDYDSLSCVINKKVGLDRNGNVYILDNPTTIEYEYPHIELEDGDYNIELIGVERAYLFVRLMAQNIYTTQFATKAELNSEITQTANSITSEVTGKIDTLDEEVSAKLELKVDTNELVSEINASADVINLKSNRLIIDSTKFKLTKEGDLTCSNANITGGDINLKGETTQPKITIINPNDESVYTTISSGQMLCYSNGMLRTAFFGMIGNLSLRSNFGTSVTHSGSMSTYRNSSDEDTIQLLADSGEITCVSLAQTSRVESKKNFEKFENALPILDEIDIYKYNLKFEEDGHKKHIGFVIGEDYNYSSEITAVDENGNENGVDLYSMTSLCLQAIKEQQKIIEQLKKEINLLKESE